MRGFSPDFAAFSGTSASICSFGTPRLRNRARFCAGVRSEGREERMVAGSAFFAAGALGAPAVPFTMRSVGHSRRNRADGLSYPPKPVVEVPDPYLVFSDEKTVWKSSQRCGAPDARRARRSTRF